jgi:AcrR family transcriptional regulator
MKKNVRERIIEVASRLFYFDGYNQTGINKIIEEAGVAKASMYKHFRSKEDMAVVYLQRRHTMWMGNLNDCVSKQKSPQNKVLGCFDYLIDWLKDVDYRGCGWQNIITDLPKDQQKIRNQAVYHKNELREYIHNLLKQENHYTNQQAEQLGDEVLILIEGAIILSQIQKNDWPIKSAKGACERLLT